MPTDAMKVDLTQYGPRWHNAGRVLTSKRRLERRDTVLLLFVASVIFLWGNGFNLRLFDLSDRFKILQLAGLFLIVIATGLRMPFVSWNRYIRNYYFRAIVGLLSVALFPTFVNLVLVNGLSPIEVLRSGLMYAGLLIFIMLISCRTNSSFVAKLNAMIVGMSTTIVLSLIILSQFPAVADSLFVKTSERFGMIRLGWRTYGLGPMVLYSGLYSLVMCTKGERLTKSRVFYAVIFCTYIWYYLVISMGRRTIFALLIIICYYFLFHQSGIRKLHAVLASLLFCILLLVVLQSTALLDNVQSSYTSLLDDYKYGEGTLTIRLEGIRYYMNEFRETGYIGFGLASNRLPESDKVFVGRRYYWFNSNDHGIFAVLYQFGFLGIILTIMILFHIFRDLAIIRRRGSPEHQAIAMGIHLYLCFSIVALLQIFWKPSMSFWTGLMFFMVWRMHEGIVPKTFLIRNHQTSSDHALAEGGETSQ